MGEFLAKERVMKTFKLKGTKYNFKVIGVNKESLKSVCYEFPRRRMEFAANVLSLEYNHPRKFQFGMTFWLNIAVSIKDSGWKKASKISKIIIQILSTLAQIRRVAYCCAQTL